MKQFLIFFIGILTVQPMQAQDQKPESKPGKFHIGLDYSFIRSDMKLNYMTVQNTWNGTSYDVRKLDDQEIDDMNAREKFTRRFQSIALEAGMILLDKPGKKWLIEGNLIVGLADSYYKTYNNETDTTEMEVRSGFSLPTFALNFRFQYRFTPHWGIAFMPHAGYSFGVNRDIRDNTYGHIEFFDESRKNAYTYLYSRAGIMATFTIKNLTISAGPGFYVLYNTNDYKVDRTNPANGSTYLTEVRTRLISGSFMDGSIAVEWTIIDPLTFTAFGAAGNDIVARCGLRFNY